MGLDVRRVVAGKQDAGAVSESRWEEANDATEEGVVARVMGIASGNRGTGTNASPPGAPRRRRWSMNRIVTLRIASGPHVVLQARWESAFERPWETDPWQRTRGEVVFEEAQHFATALDSGEGVLRVQLGMGHPGFADPIYRQRRNALATLASQWQPGQPAPVAPYTDSEHEVWRAVCEALESKHHRYACGQFLDGKASLALPIDRVPQLEDVSDRLEPLTGFRYRPAAGLVPLREFYGSLAEQRFWSTQYVRHDSVPLYTSEPDVLHEVVGHGNSLANDQYATLYRSAGRAVRRLETEESLQFVSKVFWYTLEFGVVYEREELRAYGAGLLSSPGEIEQFRGMNIRPLDLREMGTTVYDVTSYQGLLYAAECFAEVENVIGGFWDDCDDDSIAALRRVPT